MTWSRRALVSLLSAVACHPGASSLPLTPLEWGERLFTQETFDGNGRVCSTCHELDAFGTITPERVRALYEADPTGPLFREIDSDDGLGRTYDRLLSEATVRVPMPLPGDPATGLAVRRCDAPRDTLIVLHRGNPTVYNAGLELNLMVDGREGADLDLQARNAIRTHAEPRREAEAEELASLAAFQRSLYGNAGFVGFPIESAGLRLPVASTEAEVRGAAFLAPDRQCGICHSGPLLNRTSRFHPDALGAEFETSFVGQEPDNPNPKHDWCFVDPALDRIVPGPLGSERVFDRPTADPGMAILPGERAFVTPDDRLESAPNQELAAIIGPLFKIPTLWGVASTAPYFHDNSAKTLDEVVDQYNFLFQRVPEFAAAAGCDSLRLQCLDTQDRADIVAYLRLLSFDGRGVRAGAPGATPGPP
jgi:cytochrome c peroxidase